MELGEGFFDGWPNPPDKETHKKILENSALSIVAIDEKTDLIVGFVHAISDGVHSAYLPLLEVLPPYKGRGIGRKLMERILDEPRDIYMIDLSCDEELVPFYESLGMIPLEPWESVTTRYNLERSNKYRNPLSLRIFLFASMLRDTANRTLNDSIANELRALK